ncbi:MAG: sugar transferase [Anaerovoracaceae bacterium]
MNTLYRKYLKQLFDFLLVCLLFSILCIFIPIIGGIIYLTDKGSMFYCGYRIGQNGQSFKMYKFRTMYVNAPDIRLEDGSTYNSDDDSRVTKVGHFLRKTSIDELPQLLNVFNGTMSFIGPRPDPLDWLEKYTSDEKIILSVKPGITGYNQAYFRNNADGQAKLDNDVFYAKNIPFALDLKILFKTIETVVLQKKIILIRNEYLN